MIPEDHEKEAARVRIEIYRKMTPEQKYREMVKLRETAWQLKKAGLRMAHPDWSERQLEDAVREIFLYAST